MIFLTAGLPLFSREASRSPINKNERVTPANSNRDNDSLALKIQTIKTLIRESDSDHLKLIQEAVKIEPFKTGGEIHSLVIQHLVRSQSSNRAYNDFLINALNNIEDNSDIPEMFLATDIIQYFAMDGTVDEEEWNASLMCIKKLKGRGMTGSYLWELLYPLASKGLTTALFKRIDNYFALMASGATEDEIPDQHQIFQTMHDALVSISLELNEYDSVQYCFKNYFYPVTENKERYYWSLKSIFFAAQSDDSRNRLLELLIDYCNTLDTDEKQAHNLMDFYSSCTIDMALRQNKVEIKKRECELNRFTALCRDTLSKNLALLKDTQYHSKAALFCMQYDIPCPELIPGTGDIYDMLLSDDVEAQLTGLDYCIAMKNSSSEFMAVITGLMRMYEYKPEQRSPDVLAKGIDYLIAVNTNDKGPLSLLIQLTASPNYPVNHHAEKALCLINNPEVTAHLVQSLMYENDYIRMQVISILKHRGAITGEAESMLQTIVNAPGNKWLIAEARQALKKE